MSQWRARLALWLPVLGWMAVIFALSAQSTLPQGQDPFWDTLLRKTAHVTEYAVLSALVARAFSQGAALGAQIIARTLLIVFGYAVSDEIHQGFVPNRGPSPIDVIIDLSGAVIGLAVWHARWKARHRIGETSPR